MGSNDEQCCSAYLGSICVQLALHKCTDFCTKNEKTMYTRLYQVDQTSLQLLHTVFLPEVSDLSVFSSW